MEISIIDYGGIITSWTAADKKGDYKDIVLGFNTLAEYEAETPYLSFFGSTAQFLSSLCNNSKDKPIQNLQFRYVHQKLYSG